MFHNDKYYSTVPPSNLQYSIVQYIASSAMFTLVTSAVTRSAVRRTLSSMAAAPATLTTNDLWSATGEPLLTMSQSQHLHEMTMMPRTFREALLDQEHAVVVTTASAPHRIVHVNAAWERLCGFSKREALHQTLNILQGPDTNVNLADSIVQAVVKEHQPINRDMYLINYRKNGSPFKNHVTIAPCPLELNNGQSVELLVAVLEEVDTVPLRMAY